MPGALWVLPSDLGLAHVLTEKLQDWSLTVTQQFSKCEGGPETSISITREHARNADSQGTAKTNWIWNLEGGDYQWEVSQATQGTQRQPQVWQPQVWSLSMPGGFTSFYHKFKIHWNYWAGRGGQKTSCQSLEIYLKNFSCCIWVVRGFGLNVGHNLLMSYPLAPLCGSSVFVHTCCQRCTGKCLRAWRIKISGYLTFPDTLPHRQGCLGAHKEPQGWQR